MYKRQVLAFERVGIARYARVERLLHLAPTALGDRWDGVPAELRGRWTRMLTHARRARLLAYRVIATQQSGTVRPADTAAYRIAVTRNDQESAEVLAELAAYAPPDTRFRRAVEDHRKYSVSATVASGSIEMQRILLSRTLLS